MTIRPQSLYPLAVLKKEGARCRAFTGDTQATLTIAECLTLEAFTVSRNVSDAYHWYSQQFGQKVTASHEAYSSKHTALVLTGTQRYLCSDDQVANACRLANLANKALISGRCTPLPEVIAALTKYFIADVSTTDHNKSTVLPRFLGLMWDDVDLRDEAKSRYVFENQITTLYVMGHLTIPPGQICFGELRRTRPLCPNYGYSRGTPLDRVYLRKFLSTFAHLIAGTILDVGSTPEMSPASGLPSVRKLVTNDLNPRMGSDVVGDIHLRSTFPRHSFDCVLLLNVLEHCEEPWTVISNVHYWLRRGGLVLSVTPATQRIHPGPSDHWRILPDAFTRMFKAFSFCQVLTYGNLLCSFAALYGIAAEELTEEELTTNDPLYPVVVCVHALK